MAGFFKKNKVREEETRLNMIEHPSIADRIVDIIVILLCAFVAFCSVIPMWHVLMSSISDGMALLTHKGMVWWPVGKATLKGYQYVFRNASVLRGYLNSIVYTVATTALGFVVSAMAGYAMSRQTKLKSFMALLLTATMMFSGGMVPTYIVVQKLGLVGNPLAVIIPGCTNGMYCVMMMNAFNSVPNEMYEAARIDGAGHFSTMWKIMLPQAMNLGSVIILNTVVGAWNSWLPYSIYMPREKKLWPLQLVIQQITSENADFLNTANPDYARYLVRFAVIIAGAAPLIILFPFFQDRLEKGVIGGGVKG